MTTFNSSTLPRIAAGLIFGAAPFAAVQACGPDFPNTYLSAPFAEQSSLPTLGFRGELDRLRPASEIEAAQGQRSRLGSAAEEAAELAEVKPFDSSIYTIDRLNPPAALPEEFQLYAQGARAWRDHNDPSAVSAWEKLLQLPAAKRQYRSTWAAYMLGRAAEASAPREAKRNWELTRELAATGFADSQNLALGSWGAQARMALRAGEIAEAVRLYWQQYRHGDPAAGQSLQVAFRREFLDRTVPDQKNLGQLAADPTTRAVVTAWFVARGGPYQSWSKAEDERFKWWLTALRGTEHLTPAEADRWAWAAYSAGEWASAKTLADEAPANAPASEWVRGLLALRKGELEAAADHLAHATRGFPEATPATAESDPDYARWHDDSNEDSPHRKLEGLRGALALRQEQYFQALRIFTAAQHWADAAFVAEKLLTIEELRQYVAEQKPKPAKNGDWGDLRSLLARRLVRAGRFAEARTYFPKEVQASLDSYIAASELAYDESQPKSSRAGGFWSAAQIMMNEGMQLVGTELEPDYAIWDGLFQFPSLLDERDTALWNSPRRAYVGISPADPDPLAPTWSEHDRAEKSKTPERRFHYRYKAAELAWLAAALSPDDDPATAEILVTAGNWIANRDPEAANLFYKTLAIRCPHTELGQQALAKHWLPKT